MTSTLHLTKAHGLGNDFLIALESENPGLVPDPTLARALCARHRGIGADGLLYGLAPTAAGADLTMVLHNADGSLAEISGNGIRCLGQAALRARGHRDATIVIDAGSGRRVLTSMSTADPDVDMLRVEMGIVGDGPALAPSALDWGALHVASAEIGNPHLVLHVDDLHGIDVAREGARLEADVPGGINVHFLSAVGPNTIRLLHWERGAGVTEACGSGATVSSYLANRWGLVGDTVTVEMPGGTATVEVSTPMALIGEAVHIASIDIENPEVLLAR